MNTYNTCLEDVATYETINAYLEAGIEAGVNGTPNFLIDGVIVVEGNSTFEHFQSVIEGALAAASN